MLLPCVLNKPLNAWMLIFELVNYKDISVGCVSIQEKVSIIYDEDDFFKQAPDINIY